MPQKKQERVRVTVSMEPEVLAVFQRMAATMGVSVGRAIGDWCRDTADGLDFVHQKMIEAKTAPARVMREMQEEARGLLGEVDRLAEEGLARAADRGGLPRSGGTRGQPPTPPRPVIRGESPPSKGAKHAGTTHKS